MGYILDWDLGGPPGWDGSSSCLISGDLNFFRLTGRTEWETALVWVVVRVIPNDRRREGLDCVRDGEGGGGWLAVFRGVGLDGDFGFWDCFRAFGGTGGGGIILADDCESDAGSLHFLSMTLSQGSSFIEISPRVADKSTSILSSMGVLVTSLPLPLGTVFCLDRLGVGSTDMGSGSNGLTVSFTVVPGTLRVALPDVPGTRSPGVTS